MLNESFFNENDAHNLNKSYKAYRMVSYLLLIIGIPMIVLIAYIVSLQAPIIFLPFAIVFISILLVGYYLAFFKRLRLMKQDLGSQIKLVGNNQVISKSEKNKQLFISLDSQDLKELCLNKNLDDKIGIGDTVSFEVAKYSHHLLMMSKGDEVLIGEKLQ